MKLVRLTSLTVAAVAIALACGCSSTPSPKAVAAACAAPDPSTTGTTNLMSAELPSAAPKVGKAHLTIDDELESASTDGDENVPAPKGARPSDGSRRGGGFGSAK